ncbi:UDP-N-acetylglucosamine--LPS N-acetylglucosamine transferase [uncultured Methylobacterium sp.]|uniref:UDP-N-acetylglucosamine--LPS N-acetylglucosamine transferase n=1 Tax=uncultured Methylobacterium sp. TaxID=157278 RepID=UPI002607C199|nr:UDP-N-acetylglucosamine--LPS N-acetylglucosamine transferase [uncultured Methylobacterium sp.]
MPQEVGGRRFYQVDDASRDDKIGLIVLAAKALRILLRERPDVVISTGAAPGYVLIRIGRLLGARTIWVDSFANVDELSMSGRLVGRHCDLWLTQWAHLAKPGGPEFAGAVL